MRRLLALLVLSVAALPAQAGGAGFGDASAALGARRSAPGRGLLQTAADCARSVPYCSTCRFQNFRGTLTRAICTQCDPGYAVKRSGRACWCAPGYQQNATSGACDRCGAGSWCGGAKSTQVSAVAVPCGANKVTRTEVARSVRECVAAPGFGWAEGDESQACPLGTFNPGYNTRACSRCPGGMTTTALGATSPQQCAAPPGHYFLRGKAIACAQGTYKAAAGNADCDKCLEGWTTPFGEVGKTAGADCNHVLPGYKAAAGLLAGLGTGAAPAALCTADTYRTSAALYDAAADSSGVACTQCPPNMKTLDGPDGAGATSISQCVAPPGYGFNVTTGEAYECAQGTYNEGWDREVCKPCGGGAFTTDGARSSSPGACKILAGHSSTRGADGVSLTAAPCPAGTYGRDRDTYGLVAVECTKCLEFSTTSSTGATSAADCLTLPGHGYNDGEVRACDFATFNPGSNQDPCLRCGEGFNTSDTAAGTAAAVGADAESDCVFAAGWQFDGRFGVKPCIQGYYKTLLGNSSCLVCPSGTTTTLTIAATEQSDCDACRPGFGNADIAPGAPSCAICASGTWSYGYVSGGLACGACPTPTGYSGAMVSRRGLDTPDGCYPQFVTDSTSNSLHYDYIVMNAAVFAPQANLSVLACQEACRDDVACQYFWWRNDYEAGTTCYLRGGGVAAANVAVEASILFEISDGVYATYKALASDWDDTGRLLSEFSTFEAARASCNAAPTCIGLKSDRSLSPTQWRTFGGSLMEGATSKVRVAGEAINAWIPEPVP